MGTLPAARRDRQVVRLLILLKLLKEGGRPSIHDLAARFHTRRETIYRDLRALQAIGYPIVGDAEGRLSYPTLPPDVRMSIDFSLYVLGIDLVSGRRHNLEFFPTGYVQPTIFVEVANIARFEIPIRSESFLGLLFIFEVTGSDVVTFNQDFFFPGQHDLHSRQSFPNRSQFTAVYSIDRYSSGRL